MKKTLKLLVALMAIMIIALPAMAAERKSGLFSYSMKGNGTAIITGFDAASNGNNDVYVPAQIDGYVVSEIGARAFRNANSECILMLPDTITTIGEEAFWGSSFTSVHIPSSVKMIGVDAFGNMGKIQKIVVDAKNTVYATIDGVLYNKQSKTLVACPYHTAGYSLSVPEGIRAIGEKACADHSTQEKYIDEIVLPSTLTAIGDRAFSCTKIYKELTIPESVETIGDYAFSESVIPMEKDRPEKGLWGHFFDKGIYLPSSIKSIGKGAFAKCRYSKLGYYRYIDLADTQLVDIPDEAFYSCMTLSIDGFYNTYEDAPAAVYLPTTLKTIGDDAFHFTNVGYRDGLVLPSTVESVGKSAFEKGEGKFIIPADSCLKRIDDRAFACFKFWAVDTALVLPSGLEYIGKEAFADIEGIEVIHIPSSVTYIGENFCDRTNIVLNVEPGSYAEFWASENGYTTNLDSSEEDTSWLN